MRFRSENCAIAAKNRDAGLAIAKARSWIAIPPAKRLPRNETTGVLTAGCHRTPTEHRLACTSPHLQPALIEFNGEGRARVEVSWISTIHFSRPSPAANAAKSAAPRLMFFEPAPVA